MVKAHNNLLSRLARRWSLRPSQWVVIAVVAGLLGWMVVLAMRLTIATTAPVDAVFVLGGSIQREIYTAELAKRQPDLPILISSGAPDPCVWLIFQRAQAPMRQVWLEHCADSTFDNFRFGLPILQGWRSRKVKLLTSATHLPRAIWMGRILLGAHGIWVELEVVPERGVPGNQESLPKTVLDLGRSLAWAVVSQLYTQPCPSVISLSEVNMQLWQQQGFKCEHQAGL